MEVAPPNPPSDENDPVWRLLARSPRPAPDAWFAARTVARCRSEGEAHEVPSSVVHLWRWALAGLGICLGIMLMEDRSSTQNVVQKDVQDAFQFVASFETDPDSSPSWQDSSP